MIWNKGGSLQGLRISWWNECLIAPARLQQVVEGCIVIALVSSSSRKFADIANNVALRIEEPFRVNQLRALWVDELVSITDGSVAHPGHRCDVFRGLWMIHEVRSHVDAGCSDR